MSCVRWSLLALAVVGAMLWASLCAPPDAWAAAVHWAKRQAADSLRELGPRPELFGEAVARAAVENPVAAYARALAQLRSVPKDVAARWQQLLADPAAWPLTAEERAGLVDFAPTLAALREAATGDAAALAPAAAVDDPLLLLDGVRGALVQARAAAGTRAGLDAALVGLACGTDLLAASQPLEGAMGAVAVEIVMDALDDAWLAALPAAEAHDFAAALAEVDAAIPLPASVPLAIAVTMVDYLASGQPVESFDLGMGSVLAAWRYGFSVRRLCIARAVDLVALVQGFERESWPAEQWASRRTRLRALVAEDRARNADLRVGWLHFAEEAETGRRRALAKVRLVRLVLAEARGRELPLLLDPLGDAPFRVDATGAAPKVTGAGGFVRHLLPRR